MKFAQDNQDKGYVITSYSDSSISINGKAFEQSLIITADRLIEGWGPTDISTLQAPHIDEILSLSPELVLIGTGSRLVFPAVENYSALIQAGIGVDFMDTGAACRTYNILMGEDRDVVAGIIL